MLELFQKILSSPYGSLAFIGSIMLLAFFATWKISHFATKFSSVEKVETSIDTIKTDLQYLKGFVELFRQNNNPFAKSHSPISFTEIGKKVSLDLHLETIIANHWQNIQSKLEEKLTLDSNPYDIQVESFKIGENYQTIVTKEELAKIKQHAFKEGLNIGNYSILFGIIIRDKYLQLNGFSASDVDSHDPNKAK